MPYVLWKAKRRLDQFSHFCQNACFQPLLRILSYLLPEFTLETWQTFMKRSQVPYTSEMRGRSHLHPLLWQSVFFCHHNFSHILQQKLTSTPNFHAPASGNDKSGMGFAVSVKARYKSLKQSSLLIKTQRHFYQHFLSIKNFLIVEKHLPVGRFPCSRHRRKALFLLLQDLAKARSSG